MPRKPRRRAKGEGTIYRLKNGSWKVELVYRKADGSPGRRCATRRSHASAVEARNVLLKEIAQGIEQSPTMTVRAFLIHWLDTVGSEGKEPGTVAAYTNSVTNHLIPRLGGIVLAKLSPADVQAALSAMVKDEKGSRTREMAYIVLNTALRHALTMGVIAKNPCAKVSKPRSDRKTINPFTVEESQKILYLASQDRLVVTYTDSAGEVIRTRHIKAARYRPAVMLGLMCGMRHGEVFGLHWDRIDFDKATLQVDQQLQDLSGKVSLKKVKTKSSMRKISLPANVLAALQEHRKAMLKAGHGRAPMVFPAFEGGYTRSSNFRKRFWDPLLHAAGLAPRGFHHTRHTYATLALGAGVPVHVVSKILGHAKPSITLNIYAHVLAQHQDEATTVIDSLFNLDSSTHSYPTLGKLKSS